MSLRLRLGHVVIKSFSLTNLWHMENSCEGLGLDRVGKQHILHLGNTESEAGLY